MGSAVEIMEPTTGTEKHQNHPVGLEEDDTQIVDLERKASSFPQTKERFSTDSSAISTRSNTSSSSSSSSSAEVEENLELQVPEKETEIGLHEEEHEDGNHCNVYLDHEQGSKSADAEPDVGEVETADSLNGEQLQPETENGSTSEDNKRSREIEEIQDGDISKHFDAVDQPTGDVIEEQEELDFEDVEDYDLENVLNKQKTHELYCPNCDSCITKRVILKRRKREVRHPLNNLKRPKLPPQQNDPPLYSPDSLPPAEGGENTEHESFMFKCLSCFTIFIPKGLGSKPLPPSESVEGLETQQRPAEVATGDSNWFGSIFGFKKKESANQQVGATVSNVPEVNRPHGDLTLPRGDIPDSTANTSAFVQGGAGTLTQVGAISIVPEDKRPHGDLTLPRGDIPDSTTDTPSNASDTLTQVAKSPDTSKVDNNEAAIEDRQKFPPPSKEGNNTAGKGRLSPMKPSGQMNVSSSVSSGPDGIKIQTILHAQGTRPFKGTETSAITKPDFGQTNVTGVVGTGDITGPSSSEIDIPPVSSLGEGTLDEPLLRPVVVEGRKLEILKSIVYGGLIESITSLGVISSAAGSGASMLNILVLGIANLLGGLILIIHNLQELRDEELKITTTVNYQANSQEEGRYKRLLGRRENFTLHASVAILSFIIVGLLPPVVYYFSFNDSYSKHKKDYKVASVFAASLLCIVLLAIAKAHAKTPKGSYLKCALYYAMIAVSVSGISYVVGNFVDQLLQKYGWSDGTETPTGQMLLSLMGRKGGSFGHSSSY